MNILINAQPLLDPVGGVRTYVAEIVSQLSASADISTLKLQIGGNIVDCPQGFSVVDTNPAPARKHQSFAALKKLVPVTLKKAARRLLLRRDFRKMKDFVYFEPNHLLQNWLRKRVLTIHDLTVLTHPHFHPAERVEAFRQLPESILRADRIITVSQHVKDNLLSRFDVDPDIVVVTHLGVSHPRISEQQSLRTIQSLGIQAGFVLVVGSIEPRKNILLVTQAIQELVNDGVQINVVHAGPDGWSNRSERREISNLTKSGHWRSLGIVPTSTLSSLYRQALCLVFPSFDEGFGLPPLESMHQGTPSIASDIAVHREVLGNAALYCDTVHATSLAEQIRLIKTDDGIRERYSREGQVHASKYTWARSAEITLDVIRSL